MKVKKCRGEDIRRGDKFLALMFFVSGLEETGSIYRGIRYPRTTVTICGGSNEYPQSII